MVCVHTASPDGTCGMVSSRTPRSPLRALGGTRSIPWNYEDLVAALGQHTGEDRGDAVGAGPRIERRPGRQTFVACLHLDAVPIRDIPDPVRREDRDGYALPRRGPRHLAHRPQGARRRDGDGLGFAHDGDAGGTSVPPGRHVARFMQSSARRSSRSSRCASGHRARPSVVSEAPPITGGPDQVGNLSGRTGRRTRMSAK